jgi:hypothetical protein
MTTTQAMLPPIFRTDGLERVDLLDWDELHDTAQSILQELDRLIVEICPETCVAPGRNAIRGGDLFSYRTYRLAGSEIDPVVVGIVCASSQTGIVVRGDITGETHGDVLFEVPEREAVGRLSILEAVRDITEALSKQFGAVAAAIQDVRRND